MGQDVRNKSRAVVIDIGFLLKVRLPFKYVFPFPLTIAHFIDNYSDNWTIRSEQDLLTYNAPVYLRTDPLVCV